MDNYFTGVCSKGALRNEEHFTTEGSMPDLLPDQYKLLRSAYLTQEVVAEIQSLYADWCELLFCGFNIAVSGPQSKFELLETFKAKYLDSEQLPDYSEAALLGSKTKQQKLSIVTVRLHGLDPISMETFVNSIFGLTDRRQAKQTDLKKFLDKAATDNVHYVFMIHSFDLFLKQCEDICDIIISLITSDNSKRMHLILSSDAINAGKKLCTLKFKLPLIFFASPYGESYLKEKIQIASDVGDVNGLHRLFDDFVGLQTLKDVFSAIGSSPRKVLLLILNEFIQKSELCLQQGNNEENEEKERRKRRATGGRGKAVSTQKETDTLIYFSELLSTCSKRFIVQQSFKLRSYLDELADHKVVIFNETTIECLVSVPCCKKFLEYVATENLDDFE